MKKTIFMLLASMAVSAISCTEDINRSGTGGDIHTLEQKLVGDRYGEYETGTLMVKLTENAVGKWYEGALELECSCETSIAPVFPEAVKDDPTAVRHNLHRWFSIRFDEETSVEAMANELAASTDVSAIQYNTLITRSISDISVESNGGVMTRSSAASFPFNDERLGEQWNLINTGDKNISSTAVEGADVGVKDAWRLTAGDPKIIVAVFDEGVKYDHEDLAAAMWVNQKEKNGKPGVDDDENGYEDDIYGYNFKDDTGELSYDISSKGGDHGTHVAGTIAATNNNGIGVSSIAGGSGNGDGVRIMSCQIFDAKGNKAGRNSVAKAFYYAAKNGASIAQCSYGEDGDDLRTPASEAYKSDEDFLAKNSVEYDALKYFIDPANSNCEAIETNIAVFSAGNYNKDVSLFPGALDGCISVTAICPDFLPGGYSNYGAGCDIAAPGGDIVDGDNNAPCMILSTGISGDDFVKRDGYVYKYGTSMACPHVSGVIALGMSYALKTGKKFSREDFISRLLTSSVNIDSYMQPGLTKLYYADKSYIPVDVTVKKNKMGAGAVNAWNFLMAIEGTPTVLAKTGETVSINIAEYIGSTAGGFDYTVSIDSDSKSSLGLESDPVVTDGVMEITCTRSGAGKIRFSSSVGASGEISGLDFYKEISVVSRLSVASNGGWL